MQPVYVRYRAGRHHARSGGRHRQRRRHRAHRDGPARACATCWAASTTPRCRRSLVLKRFLAFNRNVQVRDGELLADSDGDGLSDDDEVALGLDPRQPDTDGDGLMDGIELRMGLEPRWATWTSSTAATSRWTRTETGSTPARSACSAPTRAWATRTRTGCRTWWRRSAAPTRSSPRTCWTRTATASPTSRRRMPTGTPLSADLAFQAERGYGYSLEPAEPTADGRACYKVRAENITVVPTLRAAPPALPGRDHPRRAPTTSTSTCRWAGTMIRAAPASARSSSRPVRYSEDKGKEPSRHLAPSPQTTSSSAPEPSFMCGGFTPRSHWGLPPTLPIAHPRLVVQPLNFLKDSVDS